MKWALAALALVACGRAAPAPVTATPAPTMAVDAAVDAAPHLTLQRIAVVGASVSAGFTAPRIADAMRAAGAIEVTDAADLWMFRDPDGNGAQQLAAAKASAPSLVVALDFLFWFAYQPGDRAARAASLERGLALLATVDGPLAVGDLADMRGADPRMLPPTSVPPADELATMNARIAAWAAARPQTIVLPLAAWTAPLLAGAEVELTPGERIAASSLLFLDGLHPNPLGLWYLLGKLDGALEGGFGIDASALVFARP